MARISAERASKSMDAVLERVSKKGERIVLTNKGKALAAMIPMEELALLEELEERLDLAAAKKAWAEQGAEPPLPWERVIKELGRE